MTPLAQSVSVLLCLLLACFLVRGHRRDAQGVAAPKRPRRKLDTDDIQDCARRWVIFGCRHRKAPPPPQNFAPAGENLERLGAWGAAGSGAFSREHYLTLVTRPQHRRRWCVGIHDPTGRALLLIANLIFN